VSATASRHARARRTTRPPALSSAASSATERPGRSTAARTVTSPAGIGPSTSTVMRPIWVSGCGAQRSSARTSSAVGGPACCASANQGPVVATVAWKRAPSGPSSGRKNGSDTD
jgi:hypothetical protein